MGRAGNDGRLGGCGKKDTDRGDRSCMTIDLMRGILRGIKDANTRIVRTSYELATGLLGDPSAK